MHLLLTDRLSCPRCGPAFGLILLAGRLAERVVRDGALGCSNCRDSFPIADGFVDLRAPPRGALPAGLAGAPPEVDERGGDRLVALLGIVGGPGVLALVGEPARHAPAAAAALQELQVAGVDPDLQGWPEVPGVSRLASGPGLPFFDRSVRAVAVDGRLGSSVLAEAARVVSPRGRVVVTRAAEGVSSILEGDGLEVLASEAETVVAIRG